MLDLVQSNSLWLSYSFLVVSKAVLLLNKGISFTRIHLVQSIYKGNSKVNKQSLKNLQLTALAALVIGISSSIYAANTVTGTDSNAFGDNNTVSAARSTALGVGNTVSGENSVAAGYANTVAGHHSVGIGDGSMAQGDTTVAIGWTAKATAENSNAYGAQAQASAKNALAVGTNSQASADSAVAVGNDSTVTGGSAVSIGASTTATGKWSTALGDSANAAGEKSAALSKDSYAKDDNAVALGTGTLTRAATSENTATVGSLTYSGFAGNTPTAVVSVGSGETVTYTPPDHTTPGRTVTITPHQRQIVNVGAGNISATSTDAINGSQLYAVAGVVDNVANSDGSITTTDIGGTGKNTIDEAIRSINPVLNVKDPVAPTDAANKRYVDNKVYSLDRKSRAGIAGVAAIASAPNARKDGSSMISGGIGHHRGESAFAIKASRNSDNGHWSGNVNGAVDTRGQWTVGTGFGYEW